MSVLDLLGVGRVFGTGHVRVTALQDVSLSADAGELVAVTGPSGSGKSTLLKIAGGLDLPTTGRIMVTGQDLAALGAAEAALLRRRQIGFVFQTANLFPSLTALENVALPLELDGVKAKPARLLAAALMERLNLGPLANQLPAELSGGEAQRVAVARGLVVSPALVLADEPTGSLDSLAGEAVMKLLKNQCRSGAAVVVVTHDPRHAAWADRMVFLRDGRVVDHLAAPPGPESLLPGHLS